MKRIGKFLTIFAVAMTLFPINARAAELLIPVGKIVGLQLSDNTVTVAAFDDVLGAEARTAGLKIGDEIVQIDTTTIDCTEDVRRALEGCDGDAELIVRRLHRDRSHPAERLRAAAWGLSAAGHRRNRHHHLL